MKRVVRDFLALLWVIVLPLQCLGAAADAPRSVSPTESVWAAKLSAQALATTVADRMVARLTRHEDVVDGRDPLQLEALLVLGDVIGERKYLEFVQKLMDRRKMPPGYVHPWTKEYFSSLSFDLYLRTCDKGYLEPFLAESRKYRAQALRASDGTLSYYQADLHHRYEDEPLFKRASGEIYLRRKWEPILIDQGQEYASRMAKAGWLSADDAFYTEAAEQFELFRSALRDPATGLWGHARGWFGSRSTVAETKWGRGQAWLLRGLVETMTYLPADSPQARRVSVIVQELAETLVKYQDEKGLWHQVVDHPESYPETSATGLISYYLARAVRQGLLPEKPYRAASLRGYEGIARSKVSADGTVYGGSATTPPLPSTEDYLTWPTPLDDAYGAAAVVLSAVGKLILESKAVVPAGGKLWTRCPRSGAP